MARTKKIKVGEVTTVNPYDLKMSSYNPRRMSATAFKQLKASIRKFGFVNPLIVQEKGMKIVGGHQRYRALLEICKEDGLKFDIPVVILKINDRKAKQLNIALNKIGGEFKQDMLSELIRDMNDDSPLTTDDVEAFGYELKDVEKILSDIDESIDKETEDEDLKPFAASITLSVKFDSVEERDVVKAILAERSAEENVKPGSILHALLVSD
jgi:ParB-like chromosome segregation protein Spo0J